ncbi:hypothetical protein Ancab_028608 [Ancistrocladus abbreviatus]
MGRATECHIRMNVFLFRDSDALQMEGESFALIFGSCSQQAQARGLHEEDIARDDFDRPVWVLWYHPDYDIITVTMQWGERSRSRETGVGHRDEGFGDRPTSQGCTLKLNCSREFIQAC